MTDLSFLCNQNTTMISDSAAFSGSIVAVDDVIAKEETRVGNIICQTGLSQTDYVILTFYL